MFNHQVALARKPAGYWQDLENVKKELAPFIDAEGVLANYHFINTQKPTLTFAISAYHGGFQEIRNILGLTKKRCSTCGQVKEIGKEFRQLRQGESERTMLRSGQCNECVEAKVKAYRDTPLGRAANIVRYSKARAKREGWEFDLTRDWVHERLEAIGWRCEVTGVEFEKTGKSFFDSWTSVSIDRKDSQKGYTMDNVQFVLAWVNKAKSNLPMADFVKFCEAVVKGGQQFG